jgi:hypothetical protein
MASAISFSEELPVKYSTALGEFMACNPGLNSEVVTALVASSRSSTVSDATSSLAASARPRVVFPAPGGPPISTTFGLVILHTLSANQ